MAGIVPISDLGFRFLIDSFIPASQICLLIRHITVSTSVLINDSVQRQINQKDMEISTEKFSQASKAT